MKKICFIAPANNYHTAKWCKWFFKQGYEIHVISFIDADIAGATVHYINTGVNAFDNDLEKVRYLLCARQISRIVNDIKPDVVNVHYATSYGTAVALSGLKEYILSVWGSDIYEFPQKSLLHKLLLKYSLKHAKCIFSTSIDMAKETRKYTGKKIVVTPFGVDMDLFSPNKRNRSEEDKNFIVGTIKTLSPTYGIEYLLKAVSIIKNKYTHIPIKLRIAGRGSHEEIYKRMAETLAINDITTWLGFIPQEQVAYEWANMDVGVIMSNLESFGVSAVEAQACETPVIISDVPGLMEATSPAKSSLVVAKADVNALVEDMIKLYNDKKLRIAMGKAGRQYVIRKCEINKCFENIEKQLFQ